MKLSCINEIVIYGICAVIAIPFYETWWTKSKLWFYFRANKKYHKSKHTSFSARLIRLNQEPLEQIPLNLSFLVFKQPLLWRTWAAHGSPPGRSCSLITALITCRGPGSERALKGHLESDRTAERDATRHPSLRADAICPIVSANIFNRTEFDLFSLQLQAFFSWI